MPWRRDCRTQCYTWQRSSHRAVLAGCITNITWPVTMPGLHCGEPVLGTGPGAFDLENAVSGAGTAASRAALAGNLQNSWEFTSQI